MPELVEQSTEQEIEGESGEEIFYIEEIDVVPADSLLTMRC
ncbi:hypothetical protein [Streptomyces sp. IBSBF 3136]